MISIEGTLNEIWSFVRNLIVTFFHSVFKTKIFLQNLIGKNNIYTSPRTYLFLSIFSNYYIFKAFEDIPDDAFLGFLDLKYYGRAFNEIKNFSVVEVILAAAPYALLVYCLIKLFVKLLGIPLSLKQFFVDSTLYFFSSSKILLPVSFFGFLGTLIIISHFSPNGNNNSAITIMWILTLLAAVVVLYLPLFKLRKSYLGFTKRLFVQFIILQILAVSSTFFIIYPFTLEKQIAELVFGKQEAEKPINVYNNVMGRDNAIIYCKKNTDSSYNLSCSFVVENKSKKACYFLCGDTLTIEIKPNSTNQPYYELVLDNDCGKTDTANQAKLIKEGEYYAIHFSRTLANKNDTTFQQILKDGQDSIVSIQFNLQTTNPDLVSGLFSRSNADVAKAFSTFKTLQIVNK